MVATQVAWVSSRDVGRAGVQGANILDGYAR